MYYFAYGSNLNLEQMKSRCPCSVPVVRAKLKDYQLGFNRTADILENKGSEVWGAIYDVPKGDMKALDRYEGYPHFYKKLDVKVESYRGKAYKVFTYAMIFEGAERPSDSYYRVIEEGYRNWGIGLKPLQQALDKSRQKGPFCPHRPK